MSKLHDELSSGDSSSWFMRTPDGDMYGPVDLSELRSWVSQGRIEPDSEISQDEEHWRPAESFSPLEIDWMTELEDGSVYGPFHLDLAKELVDSGLISGDSIIKHRKTGQTRTAIFSDDKENLQPEAGEKIDKPTNKKKRASTIKTASQKATKDVEPEPTRADEPEQSEESPAAETDVSSKINEDKTDEPEASAEGKVTSQRLELLQKSASDARDQLRAARKALTEQRAEATAMQDELRKLRDDLMTSEEARSNSDQQLLEQQDALADARSEAENLHAQLQQLQDHYDRLQIESQTQFETLDRLRAEAIEREQEYKHNISRERDRSETKTALLGHAVRLMAQDPDVDQGRVSSDLLAALDPQMLELSNRLNQLQQQMELERRRSEQLEKQIEKSKDSGSHGKLTFILLLVIVGLVVALAFVLGLRQAPSDSPASSTTSLNAKKNITLTPEDVGAMEAEQPSKHNKKLTAAPEISHDLDLKPEAASTSAPREDSSSIDWPPVSLASANVSRNNSDLVIVFSYGVFSSGTEITPEASRDLVQLSNQLREYSDAFTLLVEGHTDATPISSSGAKYVDNYALGMARAESVRNYLQTACQLPEGFIQTASAGESDPPFPNTTADSRRKNRTVVFKLTPR